MTAVVGREHAKSAYLTGAAGVLVLAIAFVMMVLAAPSHPHAHSRGSATLPAQTVSQVTQISTSAAGTGARPPAVSPGSRRP